MGSVDTTHMILPLWKKENGKRNDAHCYLCLVFKKKLKTIYGSYECGKAYHSECFTAFHCWHALQHDMKTLIELAINRTTKENPQLNKRCKHVTQIQELALPFSEKSMGVA